MVSLYLIAITVFFLSTLNIILAFSTIYKNNIDPKGNSNY